MRIVAGGPRVCHNREGFLPTSPVCPVVTETRLMGLTVHSNCFYGRSYKPASTSIHQRQSSYRCARDQRALLVIPVEVRP